MSYFQDFGLKEEPFSTSPDPSFFWLSESHRSALYRLQIAIKLKRGLSVVLGDVGTGKTTLSRRLFQAMHDTEVQFHPIFTPLAKSDVQFTHLLLDALQIQVSRSGNGFLAKALSAIEHHLLKRTLEEKKTVVVLIDEAQKLTSNSLEVLRALLNFESHQEKLLQLVLIGQAELLPLLTRSKNFWDRVSLKQVLRPLTVIETEKLIHFRLEKAGWTGTAPLFSREACQLIHQISHGYPRQITRLGHDALEQAVMKEKIKIDRSLIEDLVEQERSFFEAARAAIGKVAGPCEEEKVSADSTLQDSDSWS